MRKRIAELCMYALALGLLASAASAIPGYGNPPTDFTPQRTLFWDFSQSAWTQPVTAAGPTWNTGEMAGDSVTSSGINWYNTDPLTSRQGMIGYDNLLGTRPAVGSMTIHLQNYATQNPVKYIWFEVDALEWGDNSISTGAFAAPGENTTYEQVKEIQTPLTGGWVRINQLWTIRPNPSYEDFTWAINVPAGSGVLVDKFYISTACVPEPSALLTLGGSLAGMLGLAWRRRKA